MLADCEVIQISLTLFGLFGENVAVISVFSLHFSRSGKCKALFGTGDGLDFWHNT